MEAATLTVDAQPIGTDSKVLKTHFGGFFIA